MRPATLDDLDNVDWRGQWKTDVDGDGDEDFEGDGDGEDEDEDEPRLENFDDDFPGEEDEEGDGEEEDGAGGGEAAGSRAGTGGGGRAGAARSAPPSIPHPPAAPSGRLGRGKSRSGNVEGVQDDDALRVDGYDSPSSSATIFTPDENEDHPLTCHTIDPIMTKSILRSLVRVVPHNEGELNHERHALSALYIAA
jgi:hypothetical protein